MYVEHSKGVDIGRGQITEYATITTEARGYEYYISYFPFDKTITEYVNIHKTVKDHTGKHFCPFILVDIDSDDLPEAKSRALDLIAHWQKEYSLSPDDLSIYFSGSKGFHLVINLNSFGSPDPHEEMGSLIKIAVKELCGDIKHDTVIYENHRLMRVENSLNAKSGL